MTHLSAVNPKLAAVIRDLHGMGARKSEVKAHLDKMKTAAPLIHGSALLYVDQVWSTRKERSNTPPAPLADLWADEPDEGEKF